MAGLRYLEWDSRFFGVKIGELDTHHRHVTTGDLERALVDAREQALRCFYVEVAAFDPEVMGWCAEHGSRLADYRVVLSKPLRTVDQEPTGSVRCMARRLAADYDTLRSIALEISVQSRFAHDPGFGARQATRLYDEWIRKSFHEGWCDELLVAVDGSRPLGFLTIRRKDGVPYIDLVGVARESSGRGIGGALVREAERQCLAKGERHMKVVTQGHNVPAMRLYEGQGFRVERTAALFHHWVSR